MRSVNFIDFKGVTDIILEAIYSAQNLPDEIHVSPVFMMLIDIEYIRLRYDGHDPYYGHPRFYDIPLIRNESVESVKLVFFNEE